MAAWRRRAVTPEGQLTITSLTYADGNFLSTMGSEHTTHAAVHYCRHELPSMLDLPHRKPGRRPAQDPWSSCFIPAGSRFAAVEN